MTQPTPVTRSRLPFVAVAVWVAILAAIVAVGLLLGGRSAAAGTGSSGGAAGLTLSAPLAADPSAGASTAPGTGNDNGAGPKGPNGFGFGHRGGPGGPVGPDDGRPGRGRGPISITAINGSQFSLKTGDGWTRTIDANGATITEAGGATITLGDLKVGDQVAFKQTRNADGTYKITDVTRIPPHAGGTVKSVDANSATVTLPDGTTKTLALTGSTMYTMNGKPATAADLKTGTRIHATGTVDGSGNFTATKVEIAPAEVHGTVTAKTATTVTVKDASGATVTINVDGSTTYATRGNTSATLADVAVGNGLEAEGTLAGDGSLKATSVRFGQAGDGGPGMHGPGMHGGFGPGGMGHGHGFRNGGNRPHPNAAPAPSANGG